MNDTDIAGLERPREVMPEEIAFFLENGWVKLERLISPDGAAGVLERLQARMGQRADAQVRRQAKGGKHERSKAVEAMWANYEDPSLDDPVIAEFGRSREMARVASRLLGGRKVRYWRDEVLVKFPENEGGARTPWHQDGPYAAIDRCGKPNIWIALVDVPPEKGSMRFLSGSHRAGPMGRTIQSEKDMVEQYPFLAERYPISPPLHMKPGDATVHETYTIHSAPPNLTRELRWVYLTSFFVAEALYTGVPQRLTDQLDLTINMPLDHPRFPIIDTD